MTALAADELIQRVRAHVEAHKTRERATFTISGISALLAEYDRLAALSGMAEPVAWAFFDKKGYEHFLRTGDRGFISYISVIPEFVERKSKEHDVTLPLYATPPARADLSAGWQRWLPDISQWVDVREEDLEHYRAKGSRIRQVFAVQDQPEQGEQA